MSSKSTKISSSDSKSRTKAVLLMLEKLMSGGNPDKEQTRFLCHKLLHLVNNHEASRKEISSKSGLETILSILETCGDQVTSLTLVNTLNEIASGNGVKRLVSHDVTRVLLHTVAYLGKEANNKLLIALLNLSVKIAPKDRRFALRVRLAGALPVLLSIVRQATTSHGASSKLLASTLQCIKICSSNGVNASILGRLGAIHVLQKLVTSIGRKQPSTVKTALATLSLLIKSSRSNASHAISSGMMTNILSIYQEWHKNDLRSHRHIPARKSMLNIIKHMTALKRGKKAFTEVGGLRILHRTCKECVDMPCPKAAESLLSVGTLILRRCQPRFRLPIPTVQCSFKFQLPEKEMKIKCDPMVDDVIDESDDEEEEEVSDPIDNSQDAENDDAESSEKQEKEAPPPAPVIIPPVGMTTPPKRAPEDLSSMYEKFFPELLEYRFTEEMKNEGGLKQTESQMEAPVVVVNGQKTKTEEKTNSEEARRYSSDQGASAGARVGRNNMLSRGYSDNQILGSGPPEDRPYSYEAPSSAPSPSAHQDPFLKPSSFLPLIREKLAASGASNDCPVHSAIEQHAALMGTLASHTMSQKQVVNTVSFADLFGHIPPSFPERQVLKKCGVQRAKMLDDVARTLGQGDIINKVIYSRDGNYQPPRTNDNLSYDVRIPRTPTLNEPRNPVAAKLTPSDDLYENENGEINTPIVQDACCFTNEALEGAQATTKLPYVSCGCRETYISMMHEESPDGGKPRPPLRFRSDFESGNLRTAIQVREYEYDLIVDADCNSNHHHQWFYFEVSNVCAGVSYRFNIVNCEKSSSQFNFGMQPLMYSVMEARIGQPCWRRIGTNHCYYKSHFSRSAASAGGVKGRSYFTMTFTVNFQHDKDICYFAYHYPYTYTQMQADVHELINQVDEEDMYVRVQTFCHSLGGNPVPVLTVTARPNLDPVSDNQDIITEFRSRPYIFLSCRVHPGESNSSWTMRGTLKLLLMSKYSPDATPKLLEMAQQLRRSYIFKIVPMLNPDGVINGHHRCSLTGEDLNRQWADPDPKLFPTIYHTKGLLQYLHSIGKAPIVYCDYHGHSRRKNVFVYGCSRRESVLAGETDAICGAPDDMGYKGLPKLLHQLAPAFSLSSCSFVVERCKEGTARVVVWKEMGVARSYTMESTYCGCDQGKYKGNQIGTYELEEMGIKFCEALLHLKVKDRARRLPLCDLPVMDENSLSDSPSDLVSSDFNSIDPSEWGSQFMVSEPPSNSVTCPTNSDEELTPEDVGSVASFEGLNGTPQDPDTPYQDDLLIRRYPREFWDYSEFCRGFGFGSDDDDVTDDVKEPGVTSPGAGDSMPSHPTHFAVTGNHVMRSTYRICPDTGRVLYDESPTNQLADMMGRSSLLESDSPVNATPAVVNNQPK